MKTHAGARVTHEAYVARRFDTLEHRFKTEVSEHDPRVQALVNALSPLAGRLVLDLGCGKGRFATRLRASGARVVGLDVSQAMLRSAGSIERLRASARRLPLADGLFDAVVAVEVFEHLDRLDGVLEEVRRVLKPGGMLAVIDKNAGSFNSRRPWLPSLVLKWIDERRGLWMYPARGPARERWFWAHALDRELAARFASVSHEYLLSNDERGHVLFQCLPGVRRMVLWTARKPGRAA